jgi:type VI secretion system secreted protein Hcp
MTRTKIIGTLLLLVGCLGLKMAEAQISAFRTQPSGSPVTCQVKIVGAHQGAFKGDAGPLIEAIRFVQQGSSPHDPATGMATGRRQYAPIVITKEWGASSPQIMQAMATNEMLPTVVIQFSRHDPSGKEFAYQTITLTNASISAVRRYMGGETDPRPLEDVSFTFQKYELRDASGTVVSDDASGR